MKGTGYICTGSTVNNTRAEEVTGQLNEAWDKIPRKCLLST